MPTKKPRFLFTLEPEHHLALKVLAQQRGMSVSALINDMLAPALAPLLALVKASWDPSQSDLEDYLEKLEGRLHATLKETELELAARASRPFREPDSIPPLPEPSTVLPDDRGGVAGGRARTLRSARSLATPEPSQITPVTPVSNTGVTSPQRGLPARPAASPRSRSGK